jgi:3-oxoadipate enol-lactonase
MDETAIEKVSSKGIHYLECQAAGSPAVLLIHGLGANRLSWQFQMEALAKAGCRCITPDLPGFGDSPAMKGYLSISKLAGSMITLLDEVGIPSAVVIGLSMGGTVALTMGLKYPQRVDCLGLVSTFSRLRPTSASEARYFLRRIWVVLTRGLSSQASVVAERVFPGEEQDALRIVLEEQIRQADPTTYRGVMRCLGTFNVTRQLKALHMPVIVISGADDTTVPVKVQKQMAERISGATHTIIPHAGHAVIVDQPEAFNAVMLDFIQQAKTYERN